MKINAQYAMVLNLDKCIGCHTCSLPCKNVWTNRKGAEYMWFNNVECKPGIGYPQKWENQQIYRGGWSLKDQRLVLTAGGRVRKGLNIFHNPDLPVIDQYYEPWDYDYAQLIESPARKHQPAIRPRSQITGEPLDLKWGPNWEDDLAGLASTGTGDVNFKNLETATYLQFRNVFMFWLPRLCEHCLNPACVASCPSGALYKREEDGIVLVDQERCRGWRYCVSGCPYKKVYYNWHTGRAEKCLFCYPRVEAGQTTLCAHSCVGRIRYVGVLLYDADRIAQAAAAPSDQAVYPAHREMLLDPDDPQVRRAAKSQGLADNVLAAARRSPVYALICQWRLALPLHPEFRTLPMVWYVPPLSPVSVQADMSEAQDLVDQVDRMRIPIIYLANLLTAGDEAPVRLALSRLVAVRQYMRSRRLGQPADTPVLDKVGLDCPTADRIYQLLALARLEDRFVLPTAPVRDAGIYTRQGTCGFGDAM